MRNDQRTEDEVSGSDLEMFEMPETVLCVDTICNLCNAEFLDEGDLKMHVKQLHLTERSRSRYCQFCSSIFASMEEYSSHICDVHILNIRCCKYCMRAFTHSTEVKKHERKHLGSKSAFSCSNCNAIFNNVSDLEQHEYTQHGESKDGVLLQDCYSLLSSFLNIPANTFLQSLGSTFSYTCMKCKVSTSDVEYYIQHLQQMNCRSLVCDRCCNVYRKRSGLYRHFTNHLECYNKLHDDFKDTCARCNKIFNYHELQQHSKDCQAVKCSSCDLIFKTIEERADHQAQMHRTTFSIKSCKYCHREFVGQVALDKHIDRTHKRDLHLYKYFCVYCKAVFNHPKKLFSHFFGKHKDLKPFTCKTCSTTFKLRKQFTLHIKLEHNSIGNVKFDENFHVYFTNESPNDKTTITSGIPSNEQGNHESISIETVNFSQGTHVKDITDEDVDLVMCPTGTDQEQTDAILTETPVRRKRKTKIRPSTVIDLTREVNSESEDEPLIQLKRRSKAKHVDEPSFPNWHRKSKEMMKNRRKFTCKICKKYCYTYQNFNHHMSLHQTHENKKCIKCPKMFKSKDKLYRHIIKDHSSSKLTETLQNVLKRRKNGNQPINDQYKVNADDRASNTERFLKTIKKVDCQSNSTAARVTRVFDKLSVKKFIENFTPESTEANNRKGEIRNSVTIKKLDGPVDHTTVIKLTRFKPDTLLGVVKLKPPERFKESPSTQCSVTIKVIDEPVPPKMNFEPTESFDYEYEDVPQSYEEVETVETVIPDVAHEVMLEGTEEYQKPVVNVMHKIVIPNLPQVYKDVHIAHLLPEAPFYKIIKIEEVLKEQEVNEMSDNTQNIKLPDGTTLVNVNPLAHLLAGKKVEVPAKKHNKAKPIDFEKALAKAMLKSTNCHARRKSTNKMSRKH